MIHFMEELEVKALKEINDMADLARDYSRIACLLDSVWTSEILQQAQALDSELRQKYPMINNLLWTAENLPKINLNTIGYSQTFIPTEIRRLQQDKYGMLGDVLIKKGIIRAIEEFISYVD